jgi:hypothetical protein
MLTVETAARIAAILVGVGILQSALVLLIGFRRFRSTGLFEWNGLQTERPHDERGALWLRWVLAARAICALGLIIPFQNNLFYGAYALLILLTGFFLADRIRYGKDGSSQISVIIVAGLAFTFLIPTSSPFAPVGLYFIAAQALLSYFAAGLSKISSPRWRDGSAFQTIMNTATYGNARVANIVNRLPRLGNVVGWSVISAEIIFPVAVISPVGVLFALLLAGLVLHIGTAVLIGLDTFFWAFTATFPAIIVAHGALVGR